MCDQSVFLKLRATVLWGSVNVLGSRVQSESQLLDCTSECPPGAPVPTVSPAARYRATPAGGSAELLLSVSGHQRLVPVICRHVLGVLEFDKCWIGARYKLLFHYIHPHTEQEQQNQPAFVWMYFIENFRLIQHSSNCCPENCKMLILM